MRFLQFKQLSMPAKARLLCRCGVHLADRIEGDYVIALYALADFYAEVHHRFVDSEVVMIGSFYNTALLQPYLQKISVANLLQAVNYRSESSEKRLG